ncbi:MAG: hypothetical protein IVW57_00095 [Ktedonobacterales bacterium]|nr:hypothetical protein [Ktedonobacterales bacterium]
MDTFDSSTARETLDGVAQVARASAHDFGNGVLASFAALLILATLSSVGVLTFISTRTPSVPVPVAAHAAAPPQAITSGHTPVAHGEAAFVAAALPYARQVAPRIHWPVSLILAQWLVETGQQLPTAFGYNLGNVRGYPGCPLVHTASNGDFCYAATVEEGIREYVGTVGNGYYARVSPAAAAGYAHGGIIGGARAAAYALGASPWDAGHYDRGGGPGSLLIATLDRYDLYQYDR